MPPYSVPDSDIGPADPAAHNVPPLDSVHNPVDIVLDCVPDRDLDRDLGGPVDIDLDCLPDIHCDPILIPGLDGNVDPAPAPDPDPEPGVDSDWSFVFAVTPDSCVRYASLFVLVDCTNKADYWWLNADHHDPEDNVISGHTMRI